MTLLACYGFQGLKDRNCLRARRARSDFLRWTEIRHRLSTRLNSFHRASQTLLSRCPVRVTNCIAARLTRSDLHCSALSKVHQIAASSSSRRAPTCFLGLASRARQAGSCTQMTRDPFRDYARCHRLLVMFILWGGIGGVFWRHFGGPFQGRPRIIKRTISSIGKGW